MPTYETTILVDPSLSEDDISKFVSQMGKTVGEKQGKIVKEEKLGRKRLAYPIRKKNDGSYVSLHIEMPAKTLGEWERLLKLNPNVLRQMTVKL
ncbi:MAG: 30S ribosomal protein S6 [Elusimicrobia bacterium]|nr:30S ribosomal protein S6 [Elusimicrobiota bacterium]